MSMHRKPATRIGLTLVELLIVLAIIGLLIGLTIPAVQRVRQTALRVESTNNLKQIILACHQYADANRAFLPNTAGVNPVTRSYELSLFVGLLPYIDEGSSFSAYNAKYPALPGGIRQGNTEFVVRTFVSPADPSQYNPPGGYSSYAANALAFRPQSALGRSFGDGSSNTIGFAEHYGFACGSVHYSWLWSISQTVTSPVLPTGTSTTRRATFADADLGDVAPRTIGGVTHGSGGTLTFQLAPPLNACDPRLAQTPHSSGMLVALMDGSCRSLAGAMAPGTYWAAVTPAAGDVLSSDWD